MENPWKMKTIWQTISVVVKREAKLDCSVVWWANEYIIILYVYIKYIYEKWCCENHAPIFALSALAWRTDWQTKKERFPFQIWKLTDNFLSILWISIGIPGECENRKHLIFHSILPSPPSFGDKDNIIYGWLDQDNTPKLHWEKDTFDNLQALEKSSSIPCSGDPVGLAFRKASEAGNEYLWQFAKTRGSFTEIFCSMRVRRSHREIFLVSFHLWQDLRCCGFKIPGFDGTQSSCDWCHRRKTMDRSRRLHICGWQSVQHLSLHHDGVS